MECSSSRTSTRMGTVSRSGVFTTEIAPGRSEQRVEATVGSHDRAVKAEIDQARCKKQNERRGHRMDKEQLHAAKVQFIASLQESHSWKKAATSAGLQISQSNAYRLMNAVRLC